MKFKKVKKNNNNDRDDYILLIDPCSLVEAPSGQVERWVPIDNNNRDYKDFKAWTSQGNTPDPADPVQVIAPGPAV